MNKIIKKIPLTIVEDHSDILEHILKAIGSKKLKFEDNLLIHFDAHPDLLMNNSIKACEIYDKETLLNSVSIETWILPLAFAGHVTSIVWVKPEWANQIDNGLHKFYIGQDINGEIKVSLPILYFISALNYASKAELTNVREITLHVLTLENSEESRLSCSSKIVEIISSHNDSYILDVDLDFFATCNPFIDMYSDHNLYNTLKMVYEFKETELAIPKLASFKRKEQLDYLESIFKHLENIQPEGDVKMLNYINDELLSSHFVNDKTYEAFCHACTNLIKSNSGKPIDWLLIHDAGTTIDDSNRVLPHHVNKEDSIYYLAHFKNIVENFASASFISIARSSLDDYCPPDLVESIQEEVLNILNTKFSPSVNRFYSE